MSAEWAFVFYLLSAVCFGLAVLSHFFPVRSDPPRPVWPYVGILIPLGLLFFVLVPLIDTADKL
jgi:hypothetical protein